MQAKVWHVNVFLSESEGVTQARAVLTGGAPRALSAEGMARADPDDVVLAEIVEEVAVGRCLDALARQLLTAAARDIDDVMPSAPLAPGSSSS